MPGFNYSPHKEPHSLPYRRRPYPSWYDTDGMPHYKNVGEGDLRALDEAYKKAALTAVCMAGLSLPLLEYDPELIADVFKYLDTIQEGAARALMVRAKKETSEILREMAHDHRRRSDR